MEERRGGREEFGREGEREGGEGGREREGGREGERSNLKKYTYMLHRTFYNQ